MDTGGDHDRRMEPVLIILAAVLIVGLLMWRPARRRRTAEEVLEEQGIDREYDRQRDRAIESSDRIRPTDQF